MPWLAADAMGQGQSIDDCQKKCIGLATCQIFTFYSRTNWCYLYYSRTELEPASGYDSGVRQAAAPTATSASNKGPFEIRRDTEAEGSLINYSLEKSIVECEQRCKQTGGCTVFSFNKNSYCYLYSRATLKPNSVFDTGVRN
jgi:hypothetical protein